MAMVTAWVWMQHRLRALAASERGDVPGWVLVTMMTAGIVTALWFVAQPLLEGMFTDSMSDVRGPQP